MMHRNVRLLLAFALLFPAYLTGSSAETDYDQSLGEYLREILENFRKQMKDGIPEIGIPPVDPLVIENVDEDINEGIAKLVLRLRNVSIEGLSKFHIDYLEADLNEGFVNVSFELPKLHAEGYCYMDGKLLNIFPITSDGDFSFDVETVRISGFGLLHFNENREVGDHEGNLKVRLSDLLLHLSFDDLQIHFENVLGGGRWTQTLLKLLTGLGKGLFHHFYDQAMSQLDKIILKIINKELDKGTLDDLLGKTV